MGNLKSFSRISFAVRCLKSEHGIMLIGTRPCYALGKVGSVDFFEWHSSTERITS